jgi:hypothetical protein
MNDNFDTLLYNIKKIYKDDLIGKQKWTVT